MPTVSVVMPAYNSSGYIRGAIESIINQTYKNLEVIIVDDGSTDETYDVVDGYIRKNPSRIRYLYQDNRGPAAARNKGIKESSGEYIAFLDSDDIWMPNKLEEQMRLFAIDPTIELVCSGRIKVDKANNTKIVEYAAPFSRENAYLDLWNGKGIITTSSVILKKGCFVDCGLFDESEELQGTEDADMWLRIAERHSIEFIEKPLIEYSVRKDGFCRSDIKRAYESEACFVNKHINRLKQYDKNYANILRNRWFRYHLDYGLTLLDLNRIRESNNKFGKALKYKPFSLKASAYFFITLFGAPPIRWLRIAKKQIQSISYGI